MNILQRSFATLALIALAPLAQAAGKLGIENAWIRVAPPGVSTLAGYATLKNSGDAPVSILTIQSDTFRNGSIHESAIDDGVSKMRKVSLSVAPGSEVKLEPNGRHLMLTQPRREVTAGDRIEIVFLLEDGMRVPAMFDVLPADGEAAAKDAQQHHH